MAAAANAIPPCNNTVIQQQGVQLNNNITMYCCWLHGLVQLGKNLAHTIATCNNHCNGHNEEATANSMLGRNNAVFDGHPCCLNVDAWDGGKPTDFMKKLNKVAKHLPEIN